MKPYLPLLAALLGLAQCKKKADPAPVDQLPPATQTGANTFGCLLNGRPWTPQGFDGSLNLSAYYDRTYHQGTFNIAAYRYENGARTSQSIGIFSDSMRSVGRYKLRVQSHHGAGFINAPANCEYSPNLPTTYCRGELVMTRFDDAAGVFSGTFYFTMATPTCDTIRVTAGRFDYRR